MWIKWRRKGKGPKFGPGVDCYGGDAAAGRVPVLLAADRPSALSTEIINCNLNYENHEDLQHNVLKYLQIDKILQVRHSNLVKQASYFAFILSGVSQVVENYN